jgi:tRNA(Ile)-lysidine synthase
MEQKVECFIRQNGLLSPEKVTGVGVSGGIDSMALLFLLKELGYPVCALHYEHGIRGEASRADAEFVRRFCSRHNIPFVMGNGDVPGFAKANKLSLEAAARRLRYEFFENAGYSAVATAHHMDDNAESVLMNITRGCGVGGLTGINVRSGIIVRPFLCVRRKEIEEYAKRRSIPHVTDQTNFDTRYTRNRMRHVVMKELEKVNPAVVEAIGRLSQSAVRIERMIHRLADGVPVSYDENGSSVDAGLLSELDEPVAVEVFLRMCDRAGGRTDIEKTHMESVFELDRTGSEIHIKNGIFAKYQYGRLIIYKKSDRINDISFCVPLTDETVFPGGVIRKINGSLNRENCDRFSESFCTLPEDTVVRTRRDGDLFAPFGSGGKKLKDYMIDEKIPRELRDSVPLVASGNRIIWVVGYAISRDFAVSDISNMVSLKFCKG